MAKGLTAVALLLVYAATPVLADQLVKLKQDGLSDSEWNDIRPYFINSVGLIDSVAQREGVDRDRALELIRREKLLIGRVDLDEDGTPELFVHMAMGAMTCGSAGCTTDIYRLRDGHWVGFSSTTIRTPIGGERVFTLRDDERWEFYAPSHPSYRYLRKKYLKR